MKEGDATFRRRCSDLGGKCEIAIKTGAQPNASTSAQVWIRIIGKHGDSGKHILTPASGIFETGDTNTFTVVCNELGKIQSLQIGHDGSGKNTEWYLTLDFIHICTGM